MFFKGIMYIIYMLAVRIKGIKYSYLKKYKGNEAADKFVEEIAMKWSTYTIKTIGIEIEVEGKVTEVLKGSDYLVELSNGHTVKAYVSGKMRMNMIRILPGDTVTIVLSPYDLTRGRIVWNKR